MLSVLAGIPIALAHMSPRGAVWRPVAAYVQFIRSTPLLVQIYLVYYAVPALVPGAKGWSEMALGVIAMTLHHAAYMSEIIRVGIESVPRGQIEGAGLVVMEKIWDNGFRQITSSTKPITTPADLEGFKIRVPVSPLWTSLFTAFGSAPASINFAEVYTALQTGIVDGQENPLAIMKVAKLWEVQKYCSMTNHMWDGFWMLGNRDRKSVV